MQHGPAPDKRLAFGHEEAHAHDLDAVGLHRNQLLVLDLRRPSESEHHRDVGAVDVGVQHADLGAVLRQADGEVGGDGALADAALAAGDGDDVLDGHVQLAGDAAVAAHIGVEAHGHVLHAGHQLHGGDALFLDLPAQRAGGRGEHDGEAHVAVVDGDVAHHVERDQVLVQFRFLDGGEGRAYASSVIGVWLAG